jgi:hypothetical protein
LKEAVLAVLGEADRALDAQGIRRLVVDRLDRPVGLHSVITCLTKGAANPASPVVRAKTGRYATLSHGGS